MRLLLLGLEEAFWAGDKAGLGALKNLITESHITIEPKGVDAFDVANFTRLLVTSNEKWAAPVGIDERRFLVLDVVNAQANRPEYFDPIFRQMDNGGVEAMLYELLNRKINSNLRRPPETGALVGQRMQSLEGIERWLLTFAREGECRDPDDRDHVIVLDEGKPTEIACATVIAAAKAAGGRHSGREVDTSLGRLLEKVGVKRDRRRTGGQQREYVYIIPPLDELRENVERELNVPCRPEQTGDDFVRERREAQIAKAKDKAMKDALGLQEMGVGDARLRFEDMWNRFDTQQRKRRANGHAGS
jgi:hypothetical protein